jgi:phosphate transport system substrate-binding protein
LPCTIRRLLKDVITLIRLGLTSRAHLAAENLFLRKQGGRFVAPTAASTASALAEIRLPDNMRAYLPDPVGPESYPIVTLTWILLHKNYGDAQKATALRDMFRWCLTDGQQYAAELGYVALPHEIVQRSLAEIERIQPDAHPEPTSSH